MVRRVSLHSVRYDTIRYDVRRHLKVNLMDGVRSGSYDMNMKNTLDLGKRDYLDTTVLFRCPIQMTASLPSVPKF